MKKIIVLLSLLLIPGYVYATDSSSSVYLGSNLSVCTGNKYQDKSIITDSKVYFSHCMDARCINGKYKIYYNNKNKVTCSNGNTSPYVKVSKSGCSDIEGKSCNGNLYCSIIMEYDCSKKKNGESFTTTTTTVKKTTQATTTTTVTTTTEPTTEATTQIIIDTRLKNLLLSEGSIEFSSDIYEYNIEVENYVDSINVTAIPMDESDEVIIEGNTEIENGSIIKIIVKGLDESETVYNINVSKKEIIKSSNANLKSMKIRNHDITFNNKILEYVVIIESNETELDIYELIPEDEKAKVEIKNNSNLINGSKIEIVVTSEDEVNTNTYTIDIIVKKKSNIIKVLFTFIIILALLAGGYYVYKKVVSNKSGESYEYE